MALQGGNQVTITVSKGGTPLVPGDYKLIAKMAACLDRLTPGRMAINLVSVWNEVEHTMYGGDALLNNEDRYVRAEEFISVVRGMWNETPFSFEGQFYKVNASQLLLKPATVPPPPPS